MLGKEATFFSSVYFSLIPFIQPKTKKFYARKDYLTSYIFSRNKNLHTRGNHKPGGGSIGL